MAMTAVDPVVRTPTRWLAGVAVRFWCNARNLYQYHRNLKEARAAFMHTVYLEDRLLDDMGVTRDEVLWAASLPIEENAALALQVCAARRRALESSFI